MCCCVLCMCCYVVGGVFELFVSVVLFISILLFGSVCFVGGIALTML